MKYLAILFIVLCSVSCQFDKNIKGERKIFVHNTIDLNDEIIGNGGFLLACKNGLVGFEESRSLPAFYYLNINDDFIMSRFVNKGQGPNEILHPMNIQYVNDDMIGVFDIMNMAYYYFPIIKNSDSINLIKRIPFENRFYRVVKTAYEQYIGLSGEDHLFTLLDVEGKPLKTFFEYPYKDKEEMKVDNSVRSLAYQGSLMTNPASTKCIYAPYNGDIIHFYDIKKGSINLVKKIENIYPDYVFGEDNAPFKKTTNEGYVSLATTDKHVYALYCGKTLEKLLQNGETMQGQILRIFDWEGNMQDEIKLDVPCKHITVSHDENILWAIALNPDIQLVSFYLNKEENRTFNPITLPAKNYNISKTQLSDEDNDGLEDMDRLFSELLRFDMENVYKSKTKTFNLVIRNPGTEIIHIEKTSDDIDVEVKKEEKRTVVYYHIRKDNIGPFNDTITLRFDNDKSSTLNIYGNVIE